MEIRIDEFAEMIFTKLVCGPTYLAPHWAEHAEEARPLVKKLIEIGNKMGYSVYGHSVDGKKIHSLRERILLAKKEAWTIKADTLIVGDRVWIDEVRQFGECDPIKITDISEKNIYLEDRHGFHSISKDSMVQWAPEDWEDWYKDDVYWLKRADELGI